MFSIVSDSERKLMDQNVSVTVTLAEPTYQQRNRKALQIYFWLNERVGRDEWVLKRLEDEGQLRRTVYYVPYEVAMLFKLTWGGL